MNEVQFVVCITDKIEAKGYNSLRNYLLVHYLSFSIQSGHQESTEKVPVILHFPPTSDVTFTTSTL